jgi:hypothetical protein
MALITKGGKGMTVSIVVLVASLFAATALADDSADRARLGGAWQIQNEAGTQSLAVWILEEKRDAIHITYSQGDQKFAEFECNTVGRECDMKDSGRQAKVSIWFSGPKLVELETRGSEVTKRRFAVSGQGDTMELEVIPIVPAGKTETKQLKRVQISGPKQ